jgi:hypothetical protein
MIGQTKIICLCGSTRFTEQMMIKSWELAKLGIIALGWNVLPDSYVPVPSRCALGGEYADRKDALHIESHGAEAEGLKEQIDELHKRKIDLSDEVYVLNIGGYIGESTRSEIDYAGTHGKPVVYQEPRDSSI